MEYQAAVAEARTLVKRSEDDQWRLAELTYEQVESGISRRQWAQDIGVVAQHVSTLYRVWDQYGDQQLDAQPKFADVYARIHTPGRYAEGGDQEGGHYIGQAVRTVRDLPPERKAEVIREALADPEVAKHTFNAPEADDEMAAKARMYAGNAITDHDHRIQRHVQERRHEESVNTGRTDSEAIYEVSSMMQVLADVVVTGGKLARKLSDGATLSDPMRQTLAGYATKAKATIEWLEGIKDADHAEDIEEVLRVWAAES